MLRVGIFNDSFPPTIDGVANAAFNYASLIQKNHGEAIAATPRYPGVADDYPFLVYRYPSVPLGKRVGYRAGNPFSPKTIRILRSFNMDIMHVHSPFASSLLVNRVNRKGNRAPVILTYHTKFEVDIKNRAPGRAMQNVMKRMVRRNIFSADEIWLVSNGAVESLRSFGYEGPYQVMENGCDFKRERAPESAIEKEKSELGLEQGQLVFLFVGRMMWYKNTKLIIDALEIAGREGLPFKMLFVGDGKDRKSIEQYVTGKGLAGEIEFLGAVYDRVRLHTLFCLADLFLFPSTYDTSGLVVKEAAAADCPSVLVNGSCAAEGVEDGFSGFLCEENKESLAKTILAASHSDERRIQIGHNAGEHVYLSWEKAVAKAYARYEEILSNWRE